MRSAQLFKHNNMASGKGFRILLATMNFGLLATALDISAFNIQVFGVTKMNKTHVVKKLVDVSCVSFIY